MLRLDTYKLAQKIRQHIVRMAYLGKSSHLGSGLSIADIMAVLYGEIMHYDPSNPTLKDRDRFILSKGHAGACVYATLAECGFFSVDLLATHCQDGSSLSGHVSHKTISGVELSTGSLGHGLSVGAGMAYAAMLSKQAYKTFVLMSDGECDEGSNWEAILFSAHHKLDNLIAIVDYNKLQSFGSVSETLGLEPFADKWKSFGWEVTELSGHHHGELKNNLKNLSSQQKPHCFIAHTIKGKGVSFMENKVAWHYRSPDEMEYRAAMAELEQTPCETLL